jgi:hypothetical protein
VERAAATSMVIATAAGSEHKTYDLEIICSNRFPFMVPLCAHVHAAHKITEAVMEVKAFDNYDEVNLFIFKL